MLWVFYVEISPFYKSQTQSLIRHIFLVAVCVWIYRHPVIGWQLTLIIHAVILFKGLFKKTVLLSPSVLRFRQLTQILAVLRESPLGQPTHTSANQMHYSLQKKKKKERRQKT